MQISRNDIDALNAVLTIDIAKEDYEEKVSKMLVDYKKKANIPGFRKGQVPLGLVKKQYGKAVLIDEINKIIQESLHNYLTQEKLNILGNPLPVENPSLDWNAAEFSFEFELGLSPEINIDLDKLSAIKHYQIYADDAMVDNEVKTIQTRYGKLVSEPKVTKDSLVTFNFTAEILEVEKPQTIPVDELSKALQKQLMNKTAGEEVRAALKTIFNENSAYSRFLEISIDEIENPEVDVAIKIEEINRRELAELNQSLFDKIFPGLEITTEEAFKAKLKEEAESQFVQQSDQKLLNDVTEALIEQTKFDLPEKFLKKWLKTADENKTLSEKEVNEEWERTEKGLRYQLIEGKIIEDHQLRVTFEELKEYTAQRIRLQMAQYGQSSVEDKDIEAISARVLSNQDEVRRLSEHLQNQKMLAFFKKEIKFKQKKITFNDFLKEIYG